MITISVRAPTRTYTASANVHEQRMSLAPTRLRLPTLRYAVISNGIQQAPHDVPMGSVSAARVNMLLIPSYDER